MFTDNQSGLQSNLVRSLLRLLKPGKPYRRRALTATSAWPRARCEDTNIALAASANNAGVELVCGTACMSSSTVRAWHGTVLLSAQPIVMHVVKMRFIPSENGGIRL
jgi:hypothetical protein